MAGRCEIKMVRKAGKKKKESIIRSVNTVNNGDKFFSVILRTTVEYMTWYIV